MVVGGTTTICENRTGRLDHHIPQRFQYDATATMTRLWYTTTGAKSSVIVQRTSVQIIENIDTSQLRAFNKKIKSKKGVTVNNVVDHAAYLAV